MSKEIREILIELIWILLCFCLSMLIVLSFLDLDILVHSIIINILDSSVGFSDNFFIISIWLLLVFLVFGLKELKHHYRKKLANSIIILSGVLFIVSLSFIVMGWTSHPSLATLNQEGLTIQKYNLTILGIRFIILLLMSIIIFRWLRAKRLHQNDTLTKFETGLK